MTNYVHKIIVDMGDKSVFSLYMSPSYLIQAGHTDSIEEIIRSPSPLVGMGLRAHFQPKTTDMLTSRLLSLLVSRVSGHQGAVWAGAPNETWSTELRASQNITHPHYLLCQQGADVF